VCASRDEWFSDLQVAREMDFDRPVFRISRATARAAIVAQLRLGTKPLHFFAALV
jgi:hypothetical protein